MLLSVRGLSVEYRQVGSANRTVTGASLEVPAGEVVGLVGESGCGKSTLALAVLGMTRRSGQIVGGSVEFEGQKLFDVSQGSSLTEDEWRAYRGREIGLVVQHPRGAFNPVKRIGEQIDRHYQVHSGASSGEARRRTLELLEQVGINDPQRRVNSFPHELSGGMAQRALIAMALSPSPKLLIADEATTALDVTIQEQILDLLDELRRTHKLGMIVVSHDMGVVANYCDRVYLMNAGEVVEHAPVERFFEEVAHPAAIALLAAQGVGHDHRAVRLRGLPVDTRRVPPGCRLHLRCPFASSDAGCSTVHPELSNFHDGHQVRCHRAADVTALAQAARPPAESDGGTDV
ncbi:MAG: ABC transporter ATP-binding protein [Actinomycetia bacterium]|nr:ABC transporter ATP-binding protein [Actinomycetes bacterium]